MPERRVALRRREFVARLAGLAAISSLPLTSGSRAQQPAKIPKIGFLSPASASARSTALFRKGLAELGYVEGKSIAILYRFADGNFDRLPGLAAELIAEKVDIIVAMVTQASLAAAKATTSIPIVMAGVSDPLGSRLVASLARPGGNVTGTSSMSAEVVGKSLEVLKEAFPRTAHVAVIWNPENTIFQHQMLKEADAAAAALKVRLRKFAARNPEELSSAFQAISAQAPDALMVLGDPILNLHAAQIAQFAQDRRLPAMYGTREMVAAGGLMSYAPDIAEQFRRAAIYVDKILKGAKPGDLPVEQPTKIELVVNLKVARAQGFTIPSALLLRADEVIE
jgi:putative ABC transport system substrate-binding protein